MRTEVKRLDFDCKRGGGKKRLWRILQTLSVRRRRGGGLCWFRQHKEGLKPFEGTKSVHRETSSNGKLPVKSTAIQPPRWKPQIMSRRESKAVNVGGYLWNPAFCAEWSRVNQSSDLRLELPPYALWPVVIVNSAGDIATSWGKVVPCRSRVWSAPDTCPDSAF